MQSIEVYSISSKGYARAYRPLRIDIKGDKLMKKKKWTAKEAGQMLVYAVMHDIEAGKSEPLMSEAEYKKRAPKDMTGDELDLYRAYMHIRDGLIYAYHEAKAFHSHFYRGMDIFTFNLNRVAEYIKRRQTLPAILDIREYTKYYPELQKPLRDEEMDFDHAISVIIAYHFYNPDNTPAGVLEALKATQKKKAKSYPKACEAYMRLIPTCYYEDEQGNKYIDELPHIPDEKKENLMYMLFDDDPELWECIKIKDKKKLAKAVNGLLDDNIPTGEIQKKILELIDEDKHYTRHELKPDPKQVSGYEMLRILAYESKIIKEEYKDVYNTIADYLCYKGVNPKEKYTCGELADMGILAFISCTTPFDYDVLQKLPADDPRRGMTKLAVAMKPIPIEDIAPNPFPDLAKKHREILEIREEHIYKSLDWLYAYNAFLEILEEHYELEGLAEIASIETTQYEQDMHIYSHNLYETYKHAKDENIRAEILELLPALDEDYCYADPLNIVKVDHEIEDLDDVQKLGMYRYFINKIIRSERRQDE